MNPIEINNSKLYLARFYEILEQMERQMYSADMTNNITKYFISCMIPHHKAAIYMCNNLLEYTSYEPLKEIAYNIIKTQTEGIHKMQEILKTTYGFYNCYDDFLCYIQEYFKITQNMFSRMRNSRRYINVNLSFVCEMIPHHEGAIYMCNNLLKYCVDPKLRVIAQNIIKEQSNGVKKLKEIGIKLCSTSKKGALI